MSDLDASFVCLRAASSFLWQVLQHYGIPEKLVCRLENLYSKSLSAVRVKRTHKLVPHNSRCKARLLPVSLLV